MLVSVNRSLYDPPMPKNLGKVMALIEPFTSIRRSDLEDAPGLVAGALEDEDLAADGVAPDAEVRVTCGVHHAVLDAVGGADIPTTTGPVWIPMPDLQLGQILFRFCPLIQDMAICIATAQATARSASSSRQMGAPKEPRWRRR